MSSFLFVLYAITHLIIFVWCLRMGLGRKASAAFLVAMIAGGLVYDNSVIALGSVIGVGPLLETLSWPRFIMHAVLTPFMLIAASRIAVVGGLGWAALPIWQWFVWAMVATFVVMGIVGHLVGADIYPACFAGVVRYTMNLSPSQFCFEGQEATAGSGPPIPSIVGNIVTLVVGFMLWRTNGWPWLMIGSIVMFVAAAVPVGVYGLVTGNAGEVVLLLCYAATVARYSQSRQSR